MPAVACTLGTLTFKTKGAREAHIKERMRGLVVACAPPGTRTCTVSEGESFQFLCDVLEQHPDYERKRGSGVRAFHLEQSWDGKGVHATLLRTDGSSESFSWNKCGSGRRDTDKHTLSAAMREAVSGDMMAFKEQAEAVGPLTCTLCETREGCFAEGSVRGGAAPNFEVDHRWPPFCSIRDQFLAECEGQPPTAFGRSNLRSAAFLPRDDAFRSQWRAFHNQNANLQILCAACNNKKRDKEA